MASDSSNELLLRLVDSSGNFIPAESRTEVDTDYDDMLLDYNNGSFCQVDNFSFSMTVDDEDATSDAANASGGKGVGAAGQNKPTAPQQPFAKWKSGSVQDVSGMNFPLKISEFTFTRGYDSASPVLFDKCAKSDSLQSASLVKRKIVGGDKLQSFLRFDFDEVLITHVNWQDAEVIKETVRFKFRKITVKYKTQASSGKLNAAGSVDCTPPAALTNAKGT